MGSSVDRLLTALLLDGAKSAAYTLRAEERAGLTVLADPIMLDNDVVARVRGVDRGGGRFDDVVPLWRAAEYIAKGGQVDAIERPDPALLFWQAAALVEPLTEITVWRAGQSGIVVPGHTERPVGLMVAFAADRRGLGGVVWAHDERADNFLRRATWNVLGLGRIGAAQATLISQLGLEAFRSVLRASVAAALTKYLTRDEAIAGEDDAAPSLTWAIATKDAAGRQRLLAAQPPGGTRRDPWRRWNHMFEAVLGEMSLEAYGRRSGLDLDRAAQDQETGKPRPRVVASLDAPIGEGDDPDATEKTLGDLVPDGRDMLERVELQDLIDSAGLGPRQQQVLTLHLSGLSYEEIAQRLGIRAGTVGATLSQIRAKIKRASILD